MYSRYDEDFGGLGFVAFLMERKKRLNFNAPRKLLKRRDVDHRFVGTQVLGPAFFFWTPGKKEIPEPGGGEEIMPGVLRIFFVLSWMSKCDL